ncbi:3-oxoacid CoA-transferase subunit B [Alicyclobacillus tolerans]|uniref:3-oxoacid CoA-transferase subunit B n=1 Tax=Alicyclobacillus tolerans TaxID=90970 RepID=UPI001F0232F8|nr:3-oxoacid CoA-transferase subunit B [Alicyclobacillus tolerans]MCF8564929.1 3-oxoacid CoA-transferase subunit B [Alicyclobacillus tolerans]
MPDVKHLIAARAARELQDGDVVNLGIGIPTLVADYVPPEVSVFLHTENGLLGVGPTPAPQDVDPDLVNAGKAPVTQTPGASFFSSADSFAMIRGGHVDVAILGALQVDPYGRIANWSVPGQTIMGVGGAMDLLTGAKKIVVAMTHTARDGSSKIVAKASLPLTADRKVDVIITDLAVFQVGQKGLILTEVMPGSDLQTVKARTDAPFEVRLSENMRTASSL